MPTLLQDRIQKSLAAAVDFFEKLKIDYLLIGAVALSAWGRPRTTLDLDFMILVDEKGLAEVEKKIPRSLSRVDRKWLHWNPMLRGSQLRLRWGAVMIDVLRPRDRQDRAAFRRSRRVRLGRKIYRLISPEDFILQKIKLGRPRDFDDALSVLERQKGKLDRRYLTRWSRRLGATTELSYLLNL